MRTPWAWLLVAFCMLHGTAAQAQDEEGATDEESGRGRVFIEEVVVTPEEDASDEATEEMVIRPPSQEEDETPLDSEDGDDLAEIDEEDPAPDDVDDEEEAAVVSTDEDDERRPIEVIDIIGIQRSLEDALDAKRAASNLTESINAEEIGQLPDENVAEVLENIPGVQISRQGGIGEGVSVRGSNENRVEINGRGTLSDGDNRGGIRFSDLPSALVRSLTVTKVPTADMVEGSIGGTINVKTFRGLKLEDPLVVGRFTAEYAGNAEEWNNNFSTTLGNKFVTDWGDIGGLFTVSHIEKTIREDSLRVTSNTRVGQNPPQLTGLPIYYYPGFSDTAYGLQDRENTTLNGSLEWQLSPAWKLFAEGTYTHVESLSRVQSAFASFGQGPPLTDRELDGAATATFGTVDVFGATIPNFEFGIIGGGIAPGGPSPLVPPGAGNDGLQIRAANRTGTRDTDNFLAAVGGEWLEDEWKVEFESNFSVSESTTESFITTFQYNDPAAANFHTDDARQRVPFVYDVRDGELAFGPVPGTPEADNLLNPAYYSLFVARDTVTEFDNDLYEQKIDVTRYVDALPILSDVRFGFRSSQRSTERKRQSATTDTFPGISGADLGEFLVRTPGDFFDFNGGVYLDDFLTVDADRIDQVRAALAGGPANLGGAGQLAPPQGFRVDEDTYAGYLRVDFETDLLPWPVRGNAGVRYIYTDQNAEGAQLNDDDTFTPIDVGQRYDHWLPSASLVVAPLEDVQLRFGYARILRRPSFAQLAPTFEFPLNAGQAITVGDPGLRPTTAHQFDAAAEWYFAKGSAVSVGYFYKELDRVIGTERRPDRCNPIAVGGPPAANCPGSNVGQIGWTNFPGGSIQGVEVAFQHNMLWLPRPFHGLGMIANYAYQDGEREAFYQTPQNFRNAPVNLPNKLHDLNFRQLSEHSYNVTLFYQRPQYRWSWRLRWTWRSSFLVTESSDVSNTLPLFRRSRGQLNASTTLRLNDLDDPIIFSLLLQGVNLTKEQGADTAAFDTGPLVRMRDPDRRFSVGVRARF